MKNRNSKAGRSGGPPSRADRWRHEHKKPGSGEIFLSGINGVRESLASPNVDIKKIWVDSRKLSPEAYQLLKPHHELVEDHSKTACPYGDIQQGVGALVKLPHWPQLEDFLGDYSGPPPFWVVLDQVEDPMNLGQMLRTCEGAGVTGIILPERRAAGLNQTVAQISQGAFAWLPVFSVPNLRRALELLKQYGIWVVGCEYSQDAKSWHQVDWVDPIALVMGAEGSGMRSLTRKTCDHLAYLPMRGHLDSLNVGAALSAFLYEAIRQRSN